MSGGDRKTGVDALATLVASTCVRTAVLCAVVLLVGASLVGWVLGVGMVERGYQTLQNSELLSELLARSPASLTGEKRGMQNPQNIELFVKYLNALAPAVNNLDVLPGRQIDNFTVITDAALQSGILLEGFLLQDSEKMQLIITARASQTEQINTFVELLCQNEGFSELGIPVLLPLDERAVGQQFTIACVFSSLF